MVATFTVPGTITLRDVARPVAGETPADRLHRLAKKAVIEGVRVLSLTPYPWGIYRVTSGSHAGTVYEVDMLQETCTCKAGKACKHVALVLAELELLPEPSGPAAAEPVDLGAALDARDGDYPTPAEFNALVKMAQRRGVTIDHTPWGAIAFDPLTGSHAVNATRCSCRSFANVGACRHHALFVSPIADDVAVVAA